MKSENYRKKIEEKERKLKEEIQSYRRRSVYILFFNVFLVVVLFFLFNSVKGKDTTIVEGYQIAIKMPSEIYSDEEVQSKVFLINTRNYKRDFVIDRFKFQILRENVPVYNFYYDSPISSTIDRLESILVFDLSREVSLKNLKSGIYIVSVEMYLDGKLIKNSFNFSVKEEILKEIAVDPYYSIGENIIPQLVIENKTATTVVLSPTEIEWTLNNKTYTDVFSQEYSLKPGEKMFFESSNIFKINKKGSYNLKCTIYFKNGIETISKNINVIEVPEKGLKELDLNIYSDEYVVSGRKVNFNFEILNRSEKERYLYFNKVVIIIPKINYSYEVSNVKVLLGRYGGMSLVTLPLVFPAPGKYDIVFKLDAGETISKVLTLQVP